MASLVTVSLTRQAMQLGFFPRVTVRHTAAAQAGQIYIPEVNWLLGAMAIALVIGFGSSARMAAAYGIAVNATMLVTTIVFAVVAWTALRWPRWQVAIVTAAFLAIDVPMMIANGAKFFDGGYVPLVLAAAISLVMLVWHEGRRLVARTYLSKFRDFDDAWPTIAARLEHRTSGLGVFMASADHGMPPILVHHVERTRSLHAHVVLLTVVTRDEPRVALKDRIHAQPLGHGFTRMHVCFGFMEEPDVPRALDLAVRRRVLDAKLDDVTYYLARERILANRGGDMPVVLEAIFSFLSRNAVNADRHFRIAPQHVVEVGAQIDL